MQEGGRHSLIICHVTNEDEGFYTVMARNGQGEAENSAELYVQEPRPAISSQMYGPARISLPPPSGIDTCLYIKMGSITAQTIVIISYIMHP